MVKTQNQKQNFGKKPRKKRFFKKIRSRHSKKKAKSFSSEFRTGITNSELSENLNLISNSGNTKADNCVSLSTINMAHKYIRNNLSLKKNNEQIQNFYNIVKKLCFKNNEFVIWTMFIDYYQTINNLNDALDEETLFHIGLFAKKTLGKNSNEINTQITNSEKMDKIKSIFETKKIDTYEFNTKFNSLSNNDHQEKIIYYDIEGMIKDIYDSNIKNINKSKNIIIKTTNINKSTKKMIEAKQEKKAPLIVGEVKNNKEVNSVNHEINNICYKFRQEPNIKENEDVEQESSNLNMSIPGIDQYDNESLPNDEFYFMKPEVYNQQYFDNLYYIKNK